MVLYLFKIFGYCILSKEGDIMNIIDGTKITNFVDYYAKKGRKYSYFKTIKNKSIACRSDIYDYCKYTYEVGIAFQPVKQSYKNWQYADLVNIISEKIYNYFNMEPNTPEFHSELCKDFLTISSQCGKKYTYGNAQKFINMCFKYLICFADYIEYADLFSYCHIPIDSNILEQLKKCETRTTTFKYNGLPWTKLDDVNYKNLVDDYKSLISLKKC